MEVDTLIHARWVLPVIPNEILEHHSIAILSGNIVDLLPTEKAKEKYSAASTQQCYSHVLLPGLINAHTHAAMNLFKGLADDLPLMDWLQHHIWPAEQNIDSTFVRDGT
ncbi:MAG TPA: TRZ/ATZ family hydrolase, partial [Gammaproteobacteria bacterium]|nr:TRZ/ATZ family hydrolase [Gammaproteobacteria bacterium]